MGESETVGWENWKRDRKLGKKLRTLQSDIEGRVECGESGTVGS